MPSPKKPTTKRPPEGPHHARKAKSYAKDAENKGAISHKQEKAIERIANTELRLAQGKLKTKPRPKGMNG